MYYLRSRQKGICRDCMLMSVYGGIVGTMEGVVRA